MSKSIAQRESLMVSGITAVGHFAIGTVQTLKRGVQYLGGVSYLLGDTLSWTARGLLTRQVKLSKTMLASQMVRVGVRSIPIILLVQSFIGIILALQMAPTLQAYGSLEQIANIIAIAMFRELGPLLSAIVLSGFAGASIAAEI